MVVALDDKVKEKAEKIGLTAFRMDGLEVRFGFLSPQGKQK